MGATDLVLQLIDAFDKTGVAYMLAGSCSSSYYGSPALTMSAELAVQMNDGQFARVASAVGDAFNANVSSPHLPITKRYTFEHVVSNFRMRAFPLRLDAYDQTRFRRRHHVEFERCRVWLPKAEDVVITKLRWSKGGRRAKNVDDVSKILSVRWQELDQSYIRGRANQHGTREHFDDLLAKAQAKL